LLQIGCSSISLVSNLEQNGEKKIGYKFRISEVKIEGAALGEVANYNQMYSSIYIQNIAQAKYPYLFSRSKDAIPLQINLSLSLDNSEGDFLSSASAFFSIITLGILPAWMVFYTDYEIYVRVKEKYSDSDYEIGDLIYNTKLKRLATVLSPIGLINGLGENKYNKAHYLFADTHSKRVKIFYIEQLVNSIVLILEKVEPKILEKEFNKRKKILQT